MREFVVVGGGEVSEHGAVLVGDDDAAFSGGLSVDVVLNVEALLGAFVAEDLGVFIVADGADVPDGGGWEHVLGAASGVLGCAAGDEFGLAVLDEILVDFHAFGFLVGLDEEGVVKFEAVFGEHGFVAGGRL